MRSCACKYALIGYSYLLVCKYQTSQHYSKGKVKVIRPEAWIKETLPVAR